MRTRFGRRNAFRIRFLKLKIIAPISSSNRIRNFVIDSPWTVRTYIQTNLLRIFFNSPYGYILETFLTNYPFVLIARETRKWCNCVIRLEKNGRRKRRLERCLEISVFKRITVANRRLVLLIAAN